MTAVVLTVDDESFVPVGTRSIVTSQRWAGWYYSPGTANGAMLSGHIRQECAIGCCIALMNCNILYNAKGGGERT